MRCVEVVSVERVIRTTPISIVRDEEMRLRIEYRGVVTSIPVAEDSLIIILSDEIDKVVPPKKYKFQRR